MNNRLFYHEGVPHRISGKVWSVVFHKRDNLCHTFSLNQAEDLNIEEPVWLSFWMKPFFVHPYSLQNFEFTGSIFMHSGNDFSNSGQHSSVLEYYPNNLNWQMEFTIRKEKIEIEPTKKMQCGIDYFETCFEFQLNRLIQEKYSCHIPFLYTGSHTKQNWSLPVCSNQVTLEAFQLFLTEGDETLLQKAGYRQTYGLELLKNVKDLCDHTMPCQTGRYHKVSSQFFEVGNELKSPMSGQVVIRMDNSMKEYKSLVSYDGVNLLSDIGGTLGLFMGWSIAFCTDYFINLFKSKTIRTFVASTIVLVLFVGFVQWSRSVFEKFTNQEETVEFQTEKGFTPPYVTMCPRKDFINWLHQHFPCSDDFPEVDESFYGMVNHCLSHETEILDGLVESSFSLNDDTTIFLTSDQESIVLDNSLMKKVYHPRFGVCFSLDAMHWNRYFFI